MSLPRTFVGFSSTDISQYRLMCAWKAHENIDFNFTDCQLTDALNSNDEDYIKRRCRERIEMAGTYVLLIGTDTYRKTTFVKWEAEVAIEQGCRLIGVNLDHARYLTALCPAVLQSKGALFVPFSPPILERALRSWHPDQSPTHPWFYYNDDVYQQLGYVLEGDQARRPPKPTPFAIAGR